MPFPSFSGNQFFKLLFLALANFLSMSNIKHILRLHTQKQTKAEIIAQTGIPPTVLEKYIRDFKSSKLNFTELNELSDKDLEDLFGKPVEKANERAQILYNLFPTYEKELKRKGVTRGLLWKEYKIKHPDGVSISQFLWYFSQWKSQATPFMRMNHKAGDKLYIDFAGEKLAITDKQTGEVKRVEVFVTILGASQLTYVEAMMSQQKEDFIPACENALHYYCGVPAAIVPDNLRSAVTKSDKYEPTINETFADFAEHYSTTILPARSYKPKDKALVENAIKIIYTRIYAKIRGRTFYSLEELNSAINLALEEHNNKTVTGRNYSRRQLFEEIERTSLSPLPKLRYEFKKQLYALVMKNGYVSLSEDKHSYSVPYNFIGRKVKVMYTRNKVEIFYNYERIALHIRVKDPFKYTTDNTHLPPAYRFIIELTQEHLLTQAEEIHQDVKIYISKIFEEKQHIEKAYKICLGVLGLARKVGNERLTKACRCALEYGTHDYKTIKKILDEGLDKQVIEENESPNMPQHDNIRGVDYYK